MASRIQERHARVLIELEDRDAVLEIISMNASVTIEELLHHLPWMRWGYLFSILGECVQDGLVTLYQREFQFEVQLVQALPSGSTTDIRTASVCAGLKMMGG